MPSSARVRWRRQSCRSAGEYIHIAVDEATRLVSVEVLCDGKAITAVRFPRRGQAMA